MNEIPTNTIHQYPIQYSTFMTLKDVSLLTIHLYKKKINNNTERWTREGQKVKDRERKKGKGKGNGGWTSLHEKPTTQPLRRPRSK